MNEITVHGNLTANPVAHHNPNTGRTATTFDVAVNSRYYDRDRGSWTDRTPVYHRVVAFGDLAGNAAQTLAKGMTVTVTGTFADDSYQPNGADRPIRRTRLEAADIAVSLRWATAAVTRQPRTGDVPVATTSGLTDQQPAEAADEADQPEPAQPEPAAA